MPAPYHSLHRKLENVLKAFLAQNADLKATVYTFLEVCGFGASVVEPYVGIRCRHSVSVTPEVQLVLGCGGRVVDVDLRVRSHAMPEEVDPANVLRTITTWREAHDDLVARVMDTFYRDDLIAALNTLCAVEGGISVEQVDQFDMSDEYLDRSGVTELRVAITCSPAE